MDENEISNNILEGCNINASCDKIMKEFGHINFTAKNAKDAKNG
jgi:hypothetical protein